MHPFWAVARLSQDDLNKANTATPQSRRKFNVTLEEKEYSVVTVGESAGNSVSMTYAVRVPMMMNHIRVKKGEELLLQIEAKKTHKRKAPETWKDDLAKPKAKGKARPQQASASAFVVVRWNRYDSNDYWLLKIC